MARTLRTRGKRQRSQDHQKNRRLTARSKKVIHESSSAAPVESESQRYWQVEKVLEEKKIKGKVWSLVRWAGVNPATGQSYPDSWAVDLVDLDSQDRPKEKRRRGRPRKTPAIPPQELGTVRDSVPQRPEPSPALASSLTSARGPASPTYLTSGVDEYLPISPSYSHRSVASPPATGLSSRPFTPSSPSYSPESPSYSPPKAISPPADETARVQSSQVPLSSFIVPDSQEQGSAYDSIYDSEIRQVSPPSDQGYETSQSHSGDVEDSLIKRRLKNQDRFFSQGAQTDLSEPSEQELRIRLHSSGLRLRQNSLQEDADFKELNPKIVSLPYNTIAAPAPWLQHPINCEDSLWVRRLCRDKGTWRTAPAVQTSSLTQPFGGTMDSGNLNLSQADSSDLGLVPLASAENLQAQNEPNADNDTPFMSQSSDTRSDSRKSNEDRWIKYFARTKAVYDKDGWKPSNIPKATNEKSTLTPVYAIPVPLEDQAEEHYNNIFNSQRQELIDFINSTETTVPIGISDIVKQTRLLCVHPDLVHGENLTQAGTDSQLNWTLEGSSKFQFLKRLIESITQDNKNRMRDIALFVEPGPLVDLTLNFVADLGMRHRRMNHARRAVVLAPKSYTTQTDVFTTSCDPEFWYPGTYDLAVFLDTSAGSSKSQVRSVCESTIGGANAIVSLVVGNSVDHLLQSRSWDLTNAEDVRSFLKLAIEMRHNVGKTDDIELRTKSWLDTLSENVKDRENPPKNLPLFESLRNIYSESLQQPQTSDPTTAGSQVKTEMPLFEARKRSLSPDDAVSELPAKIPRTSHGAVQTDSMSVDEEAGASSKKDVTLSYDELKERFEIAESILDAMYPQYKGLESEVLLLRQKIGEIDRIKSKLEQVTSDRDALRSERLELRKELASCRELMAGSAVPEVRELAEAKKAGIRVTALEKQLASQNETTAYITKQYQAASTSAAESAETISELEEKVESLKIKASEEVTRRHAQLNKIHVDTCHNEIEKLKIENSTLRRQLEEAQKLRPEHLGMRTRSVSRHASPAIGNSFRS